MSEEAPIPAQLEAQTRLVGHDEPIRQFTDAWVQGRLHHAWLLTGPAGIGKASLAAQLAARLVSAPIGSGPVPVDPVIAAQLRAGAQPNIRLLGREMDDKGKLRGGIVVDQVRKLSGFLNQTASNGGWRVVIVDAADDLNKEAANALLKMLEEPAPGVLFLLISHAPARLLPTIRSRCRALVLRPLEAGAMRLALEQAGAAPEDLPLLMELGEGCPGRVLRWSGLGLADLAQRLDAAVSQRGPKRARLVHDLAQALGHPSHKLRFEAFMEMALIRIGRACTSAARGQPPPAPWSGPAFTDLERGPQLWDKARALASAASGLTLDPAVVVVRLFALIEAA